MITPEWLIKEPAEINLNKIKKPKPIKQKAEENIKKDDK